MHSTPGSQVNEHFFGTVSTPQSSGDLAGKPRGFSSGTSSRLFTATLLRAGTEPWLRDACVRNSRVKSKEHLENVGLFLGCAYGKYIKDEFSEGIAACYQTR